MGDFLIQFRMMHFMKSALLIALLFIGLRVSAAGLPKPSSGTIHRIDSFPSNYVTARTVDVWLPDGFPAAGPYAVVYFQDGQMLFDSSLTWNHQEWGVDETFGRLIAKRKIRPCIVVAVWNSGKQRHADYFPQKPFESLPVPVQDSI